MISTSNDASSAEKLATLSALACPRRLRWKSSLPAVSSTPECCQSPRINHVAERSTVSTVLFGLGHSALHQLLM